MINSKQQDGLSRINWKGESDMGTMELGEVQLRFAELVWHYAPLPSGELVKICERELYWK